MIFLIYKNISNDNPTCIRKKGIKEYLEQRNLLDSYKKTKRYLLSGYFRQLDLKKRKPYDLGVYYCRLNKQYRVRGYLDGTIFKVIKIDDHQK